MLKDYSQIVKGITGTPWLIVQESLDVILEIVNMRLSGEAYSDEQIEIELAAAAKRNERGNPRTQVAGGVGVVPVYGPIFGKANLMTQLSGATSLETFTSDFRELLSNDEVNQIVIDFDTPGGTSDLVAETGALIKEAREVKPVYGIANTMAGSAGLWLLSQCTKAYSTPSGKVGSLGAYTAHEDRSVENAREGRKITYISSGAFKTAGNPDEPLSTEAKEYMQEHINEVANDFKLAVAEGRGVSLEKVEADFGQGKMLSAKKAAEVGMIDGVLSMANLTDQLVEKNYRLGSQNARGELAHSVNKMRALFGGTSNLSAMEVTTDQPIDSVPSDPVEGTMETGNTSVAYSTNPHVESVGREHADVGEEQRLDGRNDEDAAEMPGARRDTSMDPENLDTELRGILGISEDADTATLVSTVESMVAELTPLREARASQEAKQAFATAYPEEAARMAKLEEKDRKTEAKDFASSFLNLTDADGRKLNKGFPAVVTERLAEVHERFALGEANLEDFTEVLNLIGNTGLVSLAENGSSKADDVLEIGDNPAQQFTDKVNEVRAADGVSFEVAATLVRERNPDLWAAYQSNRPGRDK